MKTRFFAVPLILTCSFLLAAPAKHHAKSKPAQNVDLSHIPDLKMDPPPTLLDAASEGNVADAQAALKRGADIDQLDDQYETPLMLAASGPDLKMIKFLIVHHASVNIEDLGGMTALDLVTTPDTLGLPDPSGTRSQAEAALKAAGGVTGDRNQAIASSDKRLFARVTSFHVDAGNPGIHIIEGTVSNKSAKAISYAEIDANFEDGDDVVDSAVANVQNLGPHQSWHFEVTTLANSVYGYKLTKLMGH